MQEQQQEQEQQQHEEQQKEQHMMSQFSRDSENAKTWCPSELAQPPTVLNSDTPFGQLVLNYPFYPLCRMEPSIDMTPLHLPGHMMVSDNFFRPAWLSGGPRRLKNVSVVLEWSTAEGQRLSSAVTLAEAETVRWMMHKRHPAICDLQVALHTLDGNPIDKTQSFVAQPLAGLQGLRFFNGEMYYTDKQLDELLQLLILDTCQLREDYFVKCMLLRRRERCKWIDTPIAKVFFEQGDWSKIRGQGLVEAVKAGLIANKQMKDLRSSFGMLLTVLAML